MSRVSLDTSLEALTSFDVLGVVCQEKDYRFCWLLNNRLDWKLLQEPESMERTTLEGPFSVFLCELADLFVGIRVLKNRNLQTVWLQEVPEMDFLIQITGASSAFIENTLRHLRDMAVVQWSGWLNKLSEKSKMQLIYQ